MKLKKLHILGSFVAAGIAFTTLSSNSGGIMSRSTVGCGGGGCHGTQSAATVIAVTGLPTGGYVPGTTYPLTITVSNNTASKAGFDLSVNVGTLAAVGSGMMAMSTELHHTTPQTLSSGTATWSFTWTAPATGNTTLDMKVAGNAVNGNGAADAGDHWNLATFSSARAATSVASFSEAGFSIYPNPAKDQFVLTTKGGEDVTISATSMNGSKAAISTAKISTDKYQVDIANLATGMYLLNLNVAGKPYSTRFVKR